MRDLIDENNDLNMSIMRFKGSSGGYVIHESVVANDPTGANQLSLRQAIDDIYEFDDSTPLTEVLWEGYRYMTGMSEDYGQDSVPEAFVSGSTTRYDCSQLYSQLKALYWTLQNHSWHLFLYT
jgi:hypothetical protein